jgi:hypothetical protein
MRQFMISFKKGSRRFRNVLAYRLKPIALPNGSGLNTFLHCVELDAPSAPRMTSIVSSWNVGFFNSSVRVFIYKLYNNILGTNSRVTHFNQGVDASCTFCVLSKTLPAPKETIMHLFFDCPTTDRLIAELNVRYLTNLTLDKKTFFLSNPSEFENDNRTVGAILEIFRYVLWQYKLNKKVPVPLRFWGDFQYMISLTLACSKTFERLVMDCNFFQRAQGDGQQP